MTPSFLSFLTKKYPNNYELGEIIRKFYVYYNENISSMTPLKIEESFAKIVNY